MTTIEHTRKQRLDEECTHREYTAQFVTEMTKETVLHHIGLEAIMASTDYAMNDIDIKKVGQFTTVTKGNIRTLNAIG